MLYKRVLIRKEMAKQLQYFAMILEIRRKIKLFFESKTEKIQSQRMKNGWI
jgi:hypothetical protein